MDDLSAPPDPVTPTPSLHEHQHRCHVCYQTFGRFEHLKRHSRSHTSERPFKCSHCRKGFYRVDALRRHELVHSRIRTRLAKGSHACSACTDGRRKCGGAEGEGDVCSGCRKRSLSCDYSKRNPKAQAPGGVSDTQDIRRQNFDEMQTNPNVPLATPRDSWLETLKSPCGSALTAHTQEHEPAASDKEDRRRSYVADSTLRKISDTENPDASFFDASTSPAEFSSSLAAEPGVRRNHQNGPATPDSWNQNILFNMNWSFDDRIASYESDLFQRDGYNRSLPSIDSPMERPGQNSDCSFTRAEAAGDFSSNSAHDPSRRGTSQVDSPNVSVEGSEATGSTDRLAAGRYYVEGDGARLPRIRSILRGEKSYDAEHSTLSLNIPSQPAIIHGFNRDTINSLVDSMPHQAFVSKLPQTTYTKLHDVFLETCISSTHFRKFGDVLFPPNVVFDGFIRLYFEHFQPTLPFIHFATFDTTNTNWLLLLAISAVGSHFIDVDDHNVSPSMVEFLRRAILTMDENYSAQVHNPVLLSQAKLLYCIGSRYSGEPVNFAKLWQPDLRNFYDNEWADLLKTMNTDFGEDQMQQERYWKLWADREGLKRTGYCIWLVDCMWGFHFLDRPQVSNEDKNVPLPCQEVLWEANTVADWAHFQACAVPSASMQETLQKLYVQKTLQSSMGEFSRILMIHALFRRTWEVESYLQQPLTHWTPTAERQRMSVLPDGDAIWLPGISTYLNWRNSACDCLDVLHWHANSVIGASSGLEHPTVLHLHLARVILLTPFRDIVKLATLTADREHAEGSDELFEIRQRVQKWANRDQYKARLAMIHAGVLFWHVRRYSISSYAEPSAVLLATLALWAYSMFAEREISHESNDEEPSDYPTLIQLDRPADDELVQLYVSRGTNMRANITGVGDICGRRGSERVVLEGRKLLSSLQVWGISKGGLRILTRLAQTYQKIK
ncbi:hypothetical protein VTL71DRAFT_15929 [Oculimacula yallundae]|uniref:C2H2-type domain-containing protein n=1 Tax=Oculimacula yallundae TaxID=86028 RepID=A0ABR4CF40_9HELO